jgi:hypothetical protein
MIPLLSTVNLVWVSIFKKNILIDQLKKIISLLLFIFLSLKSEGQTYTQSYVDKCTGEIKTVTTVFINGNTQVSFYNQIRTFTPSEVASGAVQTWLNSVYAQYNSMACPTNQVVQQTVQNTVSQAASSAASSSASSAASSSASSAASSSAGSTTNSGSSNTSSSNSETSSSSNNSTESKSENSSSSSESKSEQKSESKSEEKSESKSEENNEESSSEKKEEEKKEEKKRGGNINPMILASDLTSMQNPDGRFNIVLGVGWSRSSMAGDETYSANGMIWSNLKQFALNGGYTKMKYENGRLSSIHNYGTTFAYLDGNFMNLMTYTYIKPDPTKGTYGYNLGIVNLIIKNPEKKRWEYNIISSGVIFWTKPYQYSKKVTLSPQVFLLLSPISYNSTTGMTSVNRHVGFLAGSSLDYKISKRFGFTVNYKLNVNTMPNSPLLHNILVGSRMIL